MASISHPSFSSLNLSISLHPFPFVFPLLPCFMHHLKNHANLANLKGMTVFSKLHAMEGRSDWDWRLCGATTLSSNNHSAFAAPVITPELNSCVPPAIPDPCYNCCPPSPTSPTSPVIDFKFPTNNTLLRVRQPAHSVSYKYLDKYKEAVSLMKALPPDDPRNFTQQANVHCAYCDGGYSQNGFPNCELQVHASWLFFPFHRLYLYFYERILGSLIGDPTFALPFWNWDNPPGMEIPQFYTDQSSPLYDPLRDACHQPPVIVDLNYNNDQLGTDPKQQIETNLCTMYRQVVSQGKLPSLFLGKAYRAGYPPNPGKGSLENAPHNTVHAWTGSELSVDMGELYSAARDPIFFAHHSNVDRMWNIWKTDITGGRRKDFTDHDWLDSSFLFYNENKKLVRVKVRDSLDSRKLGYDYQCVDIPWLNSKPTSKYPRPVPRQAPNILSFPLTLINISRTSVKRPKHELGSDEEKEEVLVIDIEYDKTKGIKFDVFINDQGDDQIQPTDSEFGGSFVNLPHSHLHRDENYKRTNTSFRLGITDLLEEFKVKDDDSIAVTLVPRYGEKPVIIKGIKIKLVSLDNETI
ncbi:hypothetical protein CR513_51411, partial [Mucuna pruriens]